MPDTPLPTRLAQTLGITSSSVLAGSVLSLSFSLVPRILESPTPLLLRQWSQAYNAGKKAAPPFAALSSVCYFYLAYSLPSPAMKSRLYGYLIAGILSLSTVPYTILFMSKTNEKLLAKAEETSMLGKTDEIVEAGLGEETAHQLVDWWGVLNLFRGSILTSAAMVGTWTAVN